jgi:hypothetical protein
MKKFKYLLVALFAVSAAVLVVGTSTAQQKRVSPHDKVATKIGNNEITIDYGRPNAKGRKIWGGLVPNGKAWRAGADEATLITTSEPIMIGDAAVPAGKHTLYMVLDDKGGAKLAISNRAGDWGILKDGTVNEKSDLARVDMQKAKLDKQLDQFTIALEPTTGGAALKMMWEDAAYWVPITAKK